MLPAGVIDWKGKFTANGNEAAKNICPWNRTQVSSIKKKKDGLTGYSYRILFVAHNLEAFREVVIDPFNEHWIVICTQ
jgi:hypothetical protein